MHWHDLRCSGMELPCIGRLVVICPLYVDGVSLGSTTTAVIVDIYAWYYDVESVVVLH
jgi:hypothetical protein